MLHTTLNIEDFKNFDSIRFIIDSLIKEIDSNDILMCITALEFLSEIAAFRKLNAEYFNSIGLLQLTYEMMQRQKNSVDGGLVHSGLFIF